MDGMTNVAIPLELHAELKEISHKSGIKLKLLVERALRKYVMAVVKDGKKAAA